MPGDVAFISRDAGKANQILTGRPNAENADIPLLYSQIGTNLTLRLIDIFSCKMSLHRESLLSHP